jgi:hypothetical protein
MTPEELSALADKTAGTSIIINHQRFYFLVPKRQLLPPVSEELEPGSVRFLGGPAPGGGRLVAELSDVSVRIDVRECECARMMN